jgi:hypothetical protein
LISDRRRWALLTAAVFCCVGAAPPTPPAKVIAHIDLSKPFHLPPGASFTATQGPPVLDPATEETVPGSIQLCIRRRPSEACSPDLNKGLTLASGADLFSSIHFLDQAEVVFGGERGSRSLLHLQYSSFESSDGGQRRATDMIAYDGAAHHFDVIFHRAVGTNNNEEVRYIRSGPLTGAMISVEPTNDRPFGYWVTVNKLTPDYRYRQVLRYRSATIYGDGNPLAVIDSEMPNILHRLGLWHSGDPLPLPASPCPHPHLVKTELWCS